jgi:hypothetical protein
MPHHPQPNAITAANPNITRIGMTHREFSCVTTSQSSSQLLNESTAYKDVLSKHKSRQMRQDAVHIRPTARIPSEPSPHRYN